MTECIPPTRGVIRVLAIVPDDVAWDVDWSGTFGEGSADIGGDSGPCGCCSCGTIVQSDLIGEVVPGRTFDVEDWQPPELSDPQAVRHFPWLKMLVTPGVLRGRSMRRATWSDIGRLVPLGADQACVRFIGSSNVQWHVDPSGPVSIPDDHTGFIFWLDYEIRCCNCYDDAQWRLTDYATIGEDEEHTFVAPPYATHVQVQWSSFPAGVASVDIDILDAFGNVLWSATTGAPLYSMRWPDAHALRVRGDRTVVAIVTWEGV